MARGGSRQLGQLLAVATGALSHDVEFWNRYAMCCRVCRISKLPRLLYLARLACHDAAGATPVAGIGKIIAAVPSADSSAWVLLTRKSVDHVPVDGSSAPAEQHVEPAPAQQKPRSGEQQDKWLAAEHAVTRLRGKFLGVSGMEHTCFDRRRCSHQCLSGY